MFKFGVEVDGWMRCDGNLGGGGCTSAESKKKKESHAIGF